MVAFSLPFAGVVQGVGEAPAVYRPRCPERTAFYRALEEHFEEFALVHEERFERKDGPLRAVVRKAVEAFLACGRPENGFARVRCPDCRAEYLVPFSCQTRNFCPSCQQKRALLFAEKLREEILAPVPHLHCIFTIPVALRRLFLRERRLLGLLPRCAFETVKRCFRAVLGRNDCVPGMVAAIQTFGSQAQWNPHVHSLVSAGLLLRGGEFVPMPPMDEELETLLTETYRRLVLDALVTEDRLTEGFREKLLGFGHGGGFSVYGRHLILNEEPARLAHMARYAVRAPVAMDRVRATDDGRFLLEIPPDVKTLRRPPRLWCRGSRLRGSLRSAGATVLALDPLEWVRRITNQIPDAKMHMTRLYGAYSNRARRICRGEDGAAAVRVVEAEPLPKSRPSWARLLRMVFEVDPLTCMRCGAEMKVVSVITTPAVIDGILRHLRKTGKGDLFEARAPPEGEEPAA